MLSAPDPSTNYLKALKQRQPGTGIWFLESEQYAKWKTGLISSIWLHGIPGCGKTVLSSTILQNLYQYCDGDPGKATVYFYFDFKDVQKQDPELMLRSLICQLSQQCVQIPVGLDTFLSSYENGRQPPQHALLELMQQIIRGLPQSYIILDALDECKDCAELMNVLEAIAGWQLENLHTLMTSRRERDIESFLECFIEKQNIIGLQSQVVDKDIQSYVRHRLSNDKSLSKWKKDSTVVQEIETALMNGAHGMYLYALPA